MCVCVPFCVLTVHSIKDPQISIALCGPFHREEYEVISFTIIDPDEMMNSLDQKKYALEMKHCCAKPLAH